RKLSVPAVVCGVVKYIPELQREIQILLRKRHRLLAMPIPTTLPHLFDVRVSVVENMELVVTIQYNNNNNNNEPFGVGVGMGVVPSNIFAFFEQEKMDVINASTFLSDRILWHTIHLK
ncbi:hypothetical protein KI387_020386, partial [Taxus chinensis]